MNSKLRLSQKPRRLLKWGAGCLLLLSIPWLVQKIILPHNAVYKFFEPVRARHLAKVELRNNLLLNQENPYADPNTARPDPRFTAEKARKQRQFVRASMKKTGASAREIEAVLRSYQSTNINGYSGILNTRQGVYIWPAYAERGIVRGQPVWVITSYWESLLVNGGCPVIPAHVWHVAIRGVWPYDVLASERCG